MSDHWQGLDKLFVPGREILIAESTEDVFAALDLPSEKLKEIGQAARREVLCSHTASHRAEELEYYLETTVSRKHLLEKTL